MNSYTYRFILKDKLSDDNWTLQEQVTWNGYTNYYRSLDIKSGVTHRIDIDTETIRCKKGYSETIIAFIISYFPDYKHLGNYITLVWTTDSTWLRRKGLKYNIHSASLIEAEFVWIELIKMLSNRRT